MNLNQTAALLSFLSTYFPDVDVEADEQAARSFLAASSAEAQQRVIEQAKLQLNDRDFPLEELGTEANRWFGDVEEGREWLRRILVVLEAGRMREAAAVKDSNGTPLLEGDSVQVIKDLKVKGGSNDLKRGTMIKKIHLVDDPEVVECRVDGSTLVLKVCFLKKA